MSESEKDYLVYQGSKIPKVLRFAWTAFIVFLVIYLVRFALPDLTVWLKK